MNVQPFSKLFIVFLILFSSLGCHAVRGLVYLKPGHGDKNLFPKRDIKAGEVNFYWKDKSEQFDAQSILITKRSGEKVPFTTFLETTETNAFLIADYNGIFFESYLNDYTPSVMHTSFSVSKGMVHACLGVALKEGYIKNLDESITNYISELKDQPEQFERITIRHLLQMTSGIYQSDREAALFGDLAKMYYGNNFMRYIKNMRMESEPGTVHEYKQVDTGLLALIITRATGVTLSAYFQEKIWQPIGAKCDAYWSIFDKDGLEKAFCCFTTCIRDFARFGKLYMQNGYWNGRQIVPTQWIEQTTYLNPDLNKTRIDFCNHWFPAENCEDLTAQGFLGQMIYVNREKNIMILRFGNEESERYDWEAVMREIVEQMNV